MSLYPKGNIEFWGEVVAHNDARLSERYGGFPGETWLSL